MNDSSDFWKQRLLKHGHTGWSDPVLYAFDQLERMAIIKSMVAEKPIKNGMALDFGCGTGDFSKLLIKMGFTVCGYDPFVKPKIQSGKFIYANTYEEIPFKHQVADLALTVTTLDHILDGRELANTLSKIHDCLKHSASLFMFEYALDSEVDRKRYGMAKSAYQGFRLLSEWQDILNKNCFRVEEALPVPHPIISPSSGYIIYKGSYLARIRRRFPHLPLAVFWCDPALKWYANRLLQRSLTSFRSHIGSPLHLIRSRAI